MDKQLLSSLQQVLLGQWYTDLSAHAARTELPWPRGQGQKKKRKKTKWIMIKSFVPCQSELQVQKRKKENIQICTAKKSLWIGAANGLEAVWFSVRISDLMSCNACQEQHLLKRCLSDGQKCAGANTDSMHTGWMAEKSFLRIMLSF